MIALEECGRTFPLSPQGVNLAKEVNENHESFTANILYVGVGCRLIPRRICPKERRSKKAAAQTAAAGCQPATQTAFGRQ